MRGKCFRPQDLPEDQEYQVGMLALLLYGLGEDRITNGIDPSKTRLP